MGNQMMVKRILLFFIDVVNLWLPVVERGYLTMVSLSIYMTGSLHLNNYFIILFLL